MRDKFSGDSHRGTEFVGFGDDIGIKECLANNTHSQVGHVLIDINGAPISPELLDLFAILPHDVGITGYVTWLEGGSHELALLPMEITFACKNAIAQGSAKGIMNGHTFVEVIGMFNQNTMGVLWFVE